MGAPSSALLLLSEMHGKAHEPLFLPSSKKRQSLCLLIVAVTWLYLVASDFFGTVWPPGTAYNFFTLDFFSVLTQQHNLLCVSVLCLIFSSSAALDP